MTPMRNIWTLLISGILIVGGVVYYGVYEYGSYNTDVVVETYVREHISELSPEKEVLGGTFYITDIRAENGMGTVSYEDGHVAFVADFTYSMDSSSKPVILSFTIRK